MRYPILIHQTNRNTIIAVCPLLRDFFAEGSSIDNVLQELKERFLCYLHDDNIQLEIIPIDIKQVDIKSSIMMMNKELKQ